MSAVEVCGDCLFMRMRRSHVGLLRLGRVK